MTRKDYIRMAEALKARGVNIANMGERSDSPIREAYVAGAIETWKLSVIDTATFFYSDNPRFDTSKFLAACGMEEV